VSEDIRRAALYAYSVLKMGPERTESRTTHWHLRWSGGGQTRVPSSFRGFVADGPSSAVVKREAVEKRRKKVERKRELDEAIYWDRETLFSYLG
jgi:hypothetical protein